MVFFDLPTLTDQNRREYRHFRKYLVKNGFIMLQESVYGKLAQNSTVAEAIVENLYKNRPGDGLVQVLRVTENQYSKMDFIVGERNNGILDTDQRLVVL